MVRSAVPAVLLLVYAGGHYGDAALAALTGWPIEWAYALCQSAAQAALWVLVAALVPRGALLLPGALVCVMGAADALLRCGCIVAQMLRPAALASGGNLCDAHSGVNLYAWGLASLSVLAVLIAAWATAHDNHHNAG